MDKLFLDANVLFSTAYRPDAGVRRLWQLSGVSLVTSSYAVEEARRNLKTAKQRNDLEKLLVPSRHAGPLCHIFYCREERWTISSLGRVVVSSLAIPISSSSGY